MMKNRIIAKLWGENDRNGRTTEVAAAESSEGDLTRLPQQWLTRAEQTVGENPAISLAVALSAGVLIGWLIKRK